jgi:hypothetical protein
VVGGDLAARTMLEALPFLGIKSTSQFTAASPQHCLYFFPEPHGHGSFRPTALAEASSSGSGIFPLIVGDNSGQPSRRIPMPRMKPRTQSLRCAILFSSSSRIVQSVQRWCSSAGSLVPEFHWLRRGGELSGLRYLADDFAGLRSRRKFVPKSAATEYPYFGFA